MGTIDTFNENAFIAHLSSSPKGNLDAVKHSILRQRSWCTFSDVEKAATSTLGFMAFPERYIAGNFVASSEMWSLSRFSVISMKSQLDENVRRRIYWIFPCMPLAFIKTHEIFPKSPCHWMVSWWAMLCFSLVESLGKNRQLLPFFFSGASYIWEDVASFKRGSLDPG